MLLPERLNAHFSVGLCLVLGARPLVAAGAGVGFVAMEKAVFLATFSLVADNHGR